MQRQAKAFGVIKQGDVGTYNYHVTLCFKGECFILVLTYKDSADLSPAVSIYANAIIVNVDSSSVEVLH